MKFKSIYLAAIATVAFVAPALAHHTFAMFDRDKTSTVIGVVKEYEWTNPHVWVHVIVPHAGGKSVEYSFEMQGGRGGAPTASNRAIKFRSNSTR